MLSGGTVEEKNGAAEGIQNKEGEAEHHRCQSREEGRKAHRKRGRSEGGDLELQVLVTTTDEKLE